MKPHWQTVIILSDNDGRHVSIEFLPVPSPASLLSPTPSKISSTTFVIFNDRLVTVFFFQLLFLLLLLLILHLILLLNHLLLFSLFSTIPERPILLRLQFVLDVRFEKEKVEGKNNGNGRRDRYVHTRMYTRVYVRTLCIDLWILKLYRTIFVILHLLIVMNDSCLL